MNLLPFAVALSAALFMSGCGDQPSAPAEANTASSPLPTVAAASPETSADTLIADDWEPDASTSLTAVPNPVPAASGPGSTTITWTTGGRPTAAVYVLTNGGAEALFAEGSENSSEAPWIQAGLTYEFRLYSGTDRAQLLSRVTVTREK